MDMIQRQDEWILRLLALDVAFRCLNGLSLARDAALALELFQICAVTDAKQLLRSWKPEAHKTTPVSDDNFVAAVRLYGRFI